MLSFLRAQLAHRRRRYLSVLLTVVIGTAFTAATIVFNTQTRAGIEHRVGGPGNTADVVVTGGENSSEGLPADLAQRLTAVPGVMAAERGQSATVRYRADSGRGWWAVGTLPSAPLRWFGLESGRWPTGDGEIAVAADTARAAGLAPGATLSLQPADRTGTPVDDRDPRVTVTGLVDDRAGGVDAWGSTGLLDRLDGYGLRLLVTTSPGADPGEVAAAMTALAPAGAISALTGAQYAQQQITAFTDGVDVLAVVLLCFAAIALLVAGLVIANVFTILLTARRQELALLRCLGATPGQVTRQLLAEGAVLGALGSVIGVLLGAVGGVVAARLLGVWTGPPVVPVGGLLVAGLAGLLVTALAAVAPAVRTARTSPLAAWQPVATPEGDRRAGRVRTTAGLLLAIGGGAGLVLAARQAETLAAVGAAAVSAIGVLLLTRSVLPVVLRVLAPLAALAGPTGRLAAAQARRAPGRSSAAAAALLVGVTLIVTLQVAAATVGTTLDAELDQRYPVAVSVTSSDSSAETTDAAALPAGLLQTARDAGLRAEPVSGAVLRVTGGGSERSLVLAPSAAALGVTTASAATAVLDGGGAALVPGWWGLDPGTPITLTGPRGSTTLRSAPDHLAETAANGAVIVAPAVLQRLLGSAPALAIWASAPAGVDVVAAEAAVRRAAVGDAGVDVAGSALERADMAATIDTVLLIASALLGVALVIAVVGIATTLSLSVLERTRETGLLRALGMTRAELRRSVAVEAVLLSAVGAVTGVALGLFYGTAGATSVLAQAGSAAVWSVPWGTVAAVAAGALLAGLLASLLPARRAAAVTPAAALVAL